MKTPKVALKHYRVGRYVPENVDLVLKDPQIIVIARSESHARSTIDFFDLVVGMPVLEEISGVEYRDVLGWDDPRTGAYLVGIHYQQLKSFRYAPETGQPGLYEVRS